MLKPIIERNKREMSNMALYYALFLIFSLVLLQTAFLLELDSTFYSFSMFPISIVVLAYFSNKGVFKQTEIVIFLIYFFWGIFVAFYHFTGFNNFFEVSIAILSFMIFSRIMIPRKWIKRVSTFIFIYVLIMIILYYIINDSRKINPNIVGMFCFSLSVIFVTFYTTYKKLHYFILLLVSLVFLILSGSRTSMMGTFFYILLVALFRKWKLNKKKVFRILTFINVLSIFVAYFYANTLFDIYGKNLTILGKNLFTGREKIWKAAFDEISTGFHWIIGIGNRLDASEYGYKDQLATSVHNQMLGIFTAYGLLTLIFSIILISMVISNSGKSAYYKKFSLYFAFIIFSMMFFEVFFFSTTNLTIIVLIYMLLRNIEIQNIKKGDSQNANKNRIE